MKRWFAIVILGLLLIISIVLSIAIVSIMQKEYNKEIAELKKLVEEYPNILASLNYKIALLEMKIKIRDDIFKRIRNAFNFKNYKKDPEKQYIQHCKADQDFIYVHCIKPKKALTDKMRGLIDHIQGLVPGISEIKSQISVSRNKETGPLVEEYRLSKIPESETGISEVIVDVPIFESILNQTKISFDGILISGIFIGLIGLKKDLFRRLLHRSFSHGQGGQAKE